LSRLSRPIAGKLALVFGIALAACQSQEPTPAPMGGQGGSTGGRSGSGGSGRGGSGGGGTGGSAAQGGSAGSPDANAVPDTAPSTADAPSEAAPADCPATQLVCDTSGKLPRSIKDTGLFPAPPDFAKLSDRLIRYQPSYELWSDGLHKQRYLLLPKGGQIDNTDPKRWDFPVGTILVKTFLHDGPGGARPVETRLIRKISDPVEPYEFSVYKWNAAGTDAELADINDPIPVPVTVGGRNFTHNIPSKTHCGDCHTANAQVSTAIIGFDELHLADKLQASDPDIQLAALAKRNLFTAAVSATPPAITDPNPVLQRVKRFMVGQCVHCHNGQGANPIDLRPNVFVQNTVGKVPESPGVEVPPGWLRIRPRMPDRSVVYLQTLGGNLPQTLRLMPPVGVQIRDAPEFTAELENLKAWINSLPAN
jgi:hypothetical protein